MEETNTVAGFTPPTDTDTNSEAPVVLRYQPGEALESTPPPAQRGPRGYHSKYRTLLHQHKGQWVCLRAGEGVTTGGGFNPKKGWAARDKARFVSRRIDGVTYVFGRVPEGADSSGVLPSTD